MADYDVIMAIIDNVKKTAYPFHRIDVFNKRMHCKIKIGLRDGWLSGNVINNICLVAKCELAQIHPEWLGPNCELIRLKSETDERAKNLFMFSKINALLDKQKLRETKKSHIGKVVNFNEISETQKNKGMH